MLAQEIIRAKRDGAALTPAQIQDFVRGLVDGRWSEGQAAALAMAIVLRGMDHTETVALTAAMTDSGERLRWDDAGLHGPVLDKHSTGGVGDLVSLVLAPVVAACGALVPMISGRGLGHTGGTLDKLEALPGYTVVPGRERLRAVLRDAGCAIVGADAQLAPADRRLYAIRDVTATVESLPLITASILSKKLAAGLQALVMDVKVGNGAFTTDIDQALALAHSLVDVARGAGLPTVALVTDMSQPLARCAGNALEVQEALDVLARRQRGTRLETLTLALSAQLICSGGLAGSLDEAHAAALRALDSGAAAERFARMVAGLGGPRDVWADAGLPVAPVQRELRAARAGWLAAVDTRALGLAVVTLGGGRQRPGDRIDPRVGLSALAEIGGWVEAGAPLALVHAADEPAADAALQTLAPCWRIDDQPPAALPLVHAVVGGAT